MTNKTIGPTRAPSHLGIVSGCLSWRNLSYLHCRYDLLEKENKDNSNKKASVYSVPALGSQHFKSFICGHISPAVLEQSHLILSFFK